MRTTEHPEIEGEQIEDLTGVEPDGQVLSRVIDFAGGADLLEWDGRGDLDYDGKEAAD